MTEQRLSGIDRILTVKETCSILGVSKSTLWHWGRDTSLNFPTKIRVGRQRVGFRESELTAWMETRGAA